MIIVYTGNGKGKTSACVGQAIRAHGQGKTVAFGQFFKIPGQAGEQTLLAKLLSENFKANGPGFYFEGRDSLSEHRKLAGALLEWAGHKTGQCFMLVLDEALYALKSKIIDDNDLLSLIRRCREQGTHLVLSGRGLPGWLEREADLVSEIQEIKHPMRNGGEGGQKAQPGIEF